MKSKNLAIIVSSLFLLQTVFLPQLMARNKTITTLHFNVYYSDKMQTVAKFIAESSEASWVTVAGKLQTQPRSCISIVLLSGNDKTEISTDLERKIIRLRFTSYPQMRNELMREIAKIFLSEFTHGFCAAIPEQLAQAFADYLAFGYDNAADMIARDIILNDHKLSDILDGKDKYPEEIERRTWLAFIYFYDIKYVNLGEFVKDIYDFGFDAVINSSNIFAEFDAFFYEKYKALKQIYSKPDASAAMFDLDYFNRKEMKLDLPFIETKDISFSNDKSMIAFIGKRYASSDVYIYNKKENKLTKITSDLFTEYNPVISDDKRYVIYASNRACGLAGEIFDLYIYDLQTCKEILAVANVKFRNGYAISPDNTKIIYISDKSGICNAYCRDMTSNEDYPITDSVTGIFYPRWLDNSSVEFYEYADQKYYRKITEIKKQESLLPYQAELKTPEYLPSYFDMNDAVAGNYSAEFAASARFSAIYEQQAFYANRAEDDASPAERLYAGKCVIGVNDILNNNEFIFSADYLKFADEYNGANLNFFYKYSALFIKPSAGVFYQDIPNIFSDNIEAVSQYSHDMNYYGTFASLAFDASNNLCAELKLSPGKYNNDNLNLISLNISYIDNPQANIKSESGTNVKLSIDKSVTIAGNEFNYTGLCADYTQNILLNKFFVSIGASAAKSSGKDNEYFVNSLGGYSSLKAYPLNAYCGSNLVLFRSEFRMIFSDHAYPYKNTLEPLVFFECGSVWDKGFDFMNDHNKFADFKSDFGAGFRYLTYPMLIFRLDLAIPYYYRSFGNGELLLRLDFTF